MVKGYFIKGILIFFLVFISLGFVSALGETVNITVPISDGNYTTTVNFSMQSNLKVTGLANSYNVSIYCNSSGGNVSADTSSADIVLLATVTNSTADQTIFENSSVRISTITDGAFYNCSAYANNFTTKTWSAAKRNLTFDSTGPAVSAYTNTINYGNYSSTTIVLNVTVAEALMSIDSVYFNITYPNGTQVNWTKATNISNYYNLTVDISGFADGNYNITAYANDTQLNNVNSSEMITVTFDHTAPSVGISCSPSNLYVGDTISCSCSASDATSGINSTSADTPSSSSSGTFTIGCSAVDGAGNTGSGSTTYSVESGGSVGSSRGISTTSPFYSKTIPQSAKELSEMEPIVQSLAKKERIKVKINSEEHFIGIREVSANSATIEISSEPVEVNLNVGEDAKVDVDDDNFYDIYVKLNSISSNKADLSISYVHEAVEVPVVVDDGGDVDAPVDTVDDVATSEGDEGEGDKDLTWLWVLIGAIVVIGAGYWVYAKKKK